jgi:asparagine N-glycosylation enzyme membrane subunit Stt3
MGHLVYLWLPLVLGAIAVCFVYVVTRR